LLSESPQPDAAGNGPSSPAGAPFHSPNACAKTPLAGLLRSGMRSALIRHNGLGARTAGCGSPIQIDYRTGNGAHRNAVLHTMSPPGPFGPPLIVCRGMCDRSMWVLSSQAGTSCGGRRCVADRARCAGDFDATANCPLHTCMARDPKGIYRQAEGNPNAKVPGLQAAYEPPETPDLVVQCEDETPDAAAERVVALLVEKGYIR
jgi:hypothetical protein